MTDTTYALWGSGNITPENAKALLDEYVPDNVGAVYRPERVDRTQRGLRTAIDWFEDPEFLGRGGAIPSTDLIESLVAERDNNGDEIYLLALCPETLTHEDVDFLTLAWASGVTVLDLSRALDEVDLSLPCYQRPEPTKEEKAEARAEAKAEADAAKPKAPRTRKAAATKIGAPEQTENVPTPPEIFTSTSMNTAETEMVTTTAPLLPIELVDPVRDEISVQYELSLASMRLAEAIDTYVEAKVNAYLFQRGTAIVVDSLPRVADLINPCAEVLDTPPFDGPYVGQDTRAYYWTKSNNSYRPAVGKPRRGDQVVNLTDEEAVARGGESLLEAAKNVK